MNPKYIILHLLHDGNGGLITEISEEATRATSDATPAIKVWDHQLSRRSIKDVIDRLSSEKIDDDDAQLHIIERRHFRINTHAQLEGAIQHIIEEGGVVIYALTSKAQSEKLDSICLANPSTDARSLPAAVLAGSDSI